MDCLSADRARQMSNSTEQGREVILERYERNLETPWTEGPVLWRRRDGYAGCSWLWILVRGCLMLPRLTTTR